MAAEPGVAGIDGVFRRRVSPFGDGDARWQVGGLFRGSRPVFDGLAPKNRKGRNVFLGKQFMLVVADDDGGVRRGILKLLRQGRNRGLAGLVTLAPKFLCDLPGQIFAAPFLDQLIEGETAAPESEIGVLPVGRDPTVPFFSGGSQHRAVRCC